MKNVTIASSAGFCFGVKRAIDIAEQNAELKPVIYGNLVHNPGVISELKQKGITSVPVGAREKLESNNVVITAHGVSDTVLADLKKSKFNVIDTTCPLVKAVHILGRKLEADGYQVVIFGDPNHVEVKGTAGNLKSPIVVKNLEEARKLPHFGKLGLISQTTSSLKGFNEMAEFLETKADDLKVQNTVCYPTKDRQLAAEELAKKVEVMVVIGGYISANTKELHELCEKYTESHWIEKAGELKQEWFHGKNNIGITAGASTPDKDIQDVVERINSMD
ncbi:MAG: small subunit ribosomal protein S1, 4-hydroxy-3-methylbut-2-enyl diphosphate reductase [archaeon GW2011_AR3]|nr:MAG: small subunit ribosomal protein S1, 4-hydroxy-3-methylbut-2-enyl diphosphate reductase [archaeon GW2011_AR3]MBS3110160.1 4-hydroxy-3-methylbut-2-enyl diphosphate reductase [Candidatus Woesearchaeota archaeon]